MASTTTSPRWPPLPVGLGAMLRTARLQAGLSRERLAATIGSSKGHVQGMEDGLRPPSVAMAGRISQALGLDPWTDAVLRSVAVDDAELRTRRGIRHARPRRPRGEAPTGASTVPTAA